MKAPSLPMPAEVPCPVVRMENGYSSLGSTKVVMFGPNPVLPGARTEQGLVIYRFGTSLTSADHGDW